MQAITTQIVLGFCLIMSIVAFTAYGIDKRKAIKKKQRISEKTLILLAVFGGSFGAALGMSLFRHKTKHLKFTLTVPLMLVLHTALLVFLVVKTWFS